MSARATKLFNYDLAVKMWTFKPGYLGACIIALAILGGIILGSLGNVSTHTESTTAYEYKTDITGLFDVTQDPQFLDFNPATNYTGYTNVDTSDIYNPAGIKYASTNVANNYRMPLVATVTSDSNAGTVNHNTSLPVQSFDYAPRISLAQGDDQLVNTPGSGDISSGYIYGFKTTSFYDWIINTWGALDQYETIEITITRPIAGQPSQSGGAGSAVELAGLGYTSIGLYYSALGQSWVYTVDCANETVSVTISGNTFSYSIYNYYIAYGNGTQREQGIINGSSFDRSYNVALWFTYTSKVTANISQYDYMLPAYGVQINTDGGATVWDNDQNNTNYDNYAVNIVFGPNFNENTGAFDPIDLTAIGSTTLTLNRVGGGTDTLTVICNNQGGGFTGWKISLNGMSLGSIGVFPAIMLSIQKQPYYTDGWQIKVYPVTSFTDYQNIEIDETPIRQINGTAQYDLDNITFTDSAGYGLANISWSIYSTAVFMETYNAVFHNASINLYDYWPNMSSYRFALKNIALYGSSIVINGTTYPVHDQKITIDGKDYTLKNCYFSYSLDGNASITFNDINKTVDLGPIVTKTLTFNGNWGFNMGLYEGVASTKEVYDWNIKMFGDSLNTCIFIALALLAVCALACVWLKVSLKLTDKLILGAGALILVLMLVV